MNLLVPGKLFRRSVVPVCLAIGGHDHAGAAAAQTEIDLYTCGMHPAVIQQKPGNCPKCGMKLVETSEVKHRKIAEDNWREQQAAKSSAHQH